MTISVLVDFMQLRGVAAVEIQALGFAIAPGCVPHIEQFVMQGISALQSANAGEAEYELAQENLLNFARALVTEAQAQGLTDVHENVFFKVRGWICPLFPFC